MLHKKGDEKISISCNIVYLSMNEKASKKPLLIFKCLNSKEILIENGIVYSRQQLHKKVFKKAFKTVETD